MTRDFQRLLLQYLFQVREGKQFVELLEPEIFDEHKHQVVFQLLSHYLTKYKIQPSKANFVEYLSRSLKKQKQVVKDEVRLELEKEARLLFDPFNSDTGMIRDTIIEEAQRKMIKNLFREEAVNVKNADSDLLDSIYAKMGKITNLKKQYEDGLSKQGGFLIKDFKRGKIDIVKGNPTYLDGLNALTAAKGFYAPQLIIFMGGPKSFKTGTLLNIAIEYVRDGYKVFYADMENGINSIKARVYQDLLGVTRDALNSKDTQKILQQVVGRFKNMGGDMYMDYFPANATTVDDIHRRLEELKDEHGWIPDIICWDYPDLMVPIDRTVREKRLKIQAVYHDIIRLNNEWGVFSMGLSQVNKDAVNKEVIDMTGFAEDFGKAANCHAAFALCATPVEQAAGIRRILPVVQREGVAYNRKNYCVVKLDEAKMKLDEITIEEGLKLVSKVQMPEKKKARRKGELDLSKLDGDS